MATRVMVMAGGTGGHVFPALAVADCLRERGWEVSWLGTPDSFESRVVPANGYLLDTIDAFRLRGQGAAGLALAPLRMLRAMFQAWRLIRRRRPDVVLGMGGFVTGPGGLVTRLLALPLVIHEQNAIPGMTNRWLARVATRVLAAFPDSFRDDSVEVTGNPVRGAIHGLGAPAERFAGREGPAHLLVIGGSLGARALNHMTPEALAAIPQCSRPLVRHQTGRDKFEATRQAYAACGVEAELSEFIEDMAEAYAWADLVVCRAGALTVTELMNAGLGAVLVPFPHAVDDHQAANAAFLVEAGAAHMVREADLVPASFSELLDHLCGDREVLLEMAERARALALPGAAARVADVCAEVAR